ncbi:MAG TPA: hypothetical protein VFK90_03245, partial [Anaeromyxobacter sp.]|nr:hypothetical protein [Anaeromyxobacter sp.]
MEDAVDPELASMTRRLWVSAILSAPLLAVAMSEMLPGDPVARLFPAARSHWLQLLLAAPVVLWCGWPLLA